MFPHSLSIFFRGKFKKAYIGTMKSKLFTIGILLMVLISGAQQLTAQCTDMNSERIKTLLGEASYDNFRRTEIKYSKDPYDIEFQVDLLKNYEYKLVFDMTDKSEGVVVKLYDLGDKKNPTEPKLLYASSEDKMTENATFDVSFVAPKTRMLIKYEVKDATYAGCVSFVLGTIRKNLK